MMKRNNLQVTLTIVCLSFLTVIGFGQDFQKSYGLAQGNRVSVKTVAGDVSVKGYDGTTIMVTGFREGFDRDLVSIVDASTADKVDVSINYPQQCNCDARVRFEVLVPRNTNYDYDSFSSGSGNITVEEIIGMLHADSISGNVRVNNFVGAVTASSFSGDVRITQTPSAASSARQGDRRETVFAQVRGRRGVVREGTTAQTRGALIAKSISGNIFIDLVRLENLNSNQLEFSSISGNVNVRLPETLGARVEMSTVVGTLTTDFLLTIEKNALSPGSLARGVVGDGSQELKITTIAGNISLRKN